MTDVPSWLIGGVGLFIAVHLILALISFENWFYLRKANMKHHQFLQGLVRDDKEAKTKSDDASVWLGARRAEIKRRVLKIGMSDSVHPHQEPAGYGRIMQVNLSVLDNLLLNNQAVQMKCKQLLSDAAGYSAVVARRHLNPIYWLDTLIFLPRAIASGIGAKTEQASVTVNILQAIYTVLGIYLILIQTGLIEAFKVGG